MIKCITMVNINPKKYNLPPRTKLKESSSGKIFITINRKSRVIMKDGERVLSLVKKINLVDPNKKVGILSSAPICGKTKNWLLDNGISIETI